MTDSLWTQSIHGSAMANKSQKYCAAYPCKRLVPAGQSYCAEHRPSISKKKTDSFYSTAQWQRFRAWYRTKHPFCEECLKHDQFVPMAIVDHIVEIKDGGAKLSEGNCQSLCRSCHQKKTAAESRKRSKNHQIGSASHRVGNTIES